MRGHLHQPRVPEECSEEAADLMAECGSVDPGNRPTAQQVMQRLQAMLVERRLGQGRGSGGYGTGAQASLSSAGANEGGG